MRSAAGYGAPRRRAVVARTRSGGGAPRPPAGGARVRSRRARRGRADHNPTARRRRRHAAGQTANPPRARRQIPHAQQRNTHRNTHTLYRGEAEGKKQKKQREQTKHRRTMKKEKSPRRRTKNAGHRRGSVGDDANPDVSPVHVPRLLAAPRRSGEVGGNAPPCHRPKISEKNTTKRSHAPPPPSPPASPEPHRPQGWPRGLAGRQAIPSGTTRPECTQSPHRWWGAHCQPPPYAPVRRPPPPRPKPTSSAHNRAAATPRRARACPVGADHKSKHGELTDGPMSARPPGPSTGTRMPPPAPRYEL